MTFRRQCLIEKMATKDFQYGVLMRRLPFRILFFWQRAIRRDKVRELL